MTKTGTCLALALVLALACWTMPRSARADIPEPTRDQGFRLIDLDLNETGTVTLPDGSEVRVKVTALEETRDQVREAIREARVQVEVDGTNVELFSSHYHLPVTVGGVRIDCPVTRGHYEGVGSIGGAPWGLEKQVRLRLWPADSSLTEPGTFLYPLRQRWFASATSMANEPIDAGVKTSYRYHYDLDFGGAENLTEVIAATDGLVVSSANQTLPGYEDTPVKARYDVIYVLDDRGFYYRYSHFHRIDSEAWVGKRVRAGQMLGLLGKEGASGGWAHLHFGIWMKMPSGKWGSIDSYPLVWEAYLRDHQPGVVAVARPNHLIHAGDSTTLDASKSWTAEGELSCHWTFHDGTTAEGPQVTRTYTQAGNYREILRVTNERGEVSYDFAPVQVVDPATPDDFPARVHAAFHPTTGIKPGDPVTILVRSFRTTEGHETIDFGDGSPTVRVTSGAGLENLHPEGYASTIHRYEKPGDYIVRIDRENERGWPAFDLLHIRVEP